MISRQHMATTLLVSMVAGSVAGVVAEAQDVPTQARTGHLETPNDPPAVLGERRTSRPSGGAGDGPSLSVQVNVDANGNNIVGDAANEPSLAVDPTAPNRMAIGWRQFDSVGSDFRQAGYGWSNDGGRTWNFPGVFTPGTFRSDPVLDADDDGTFFYYSLKGDFTCDMFISANAGQSYSSPITAFGGDKAWITIDKTAGIGRGNTYVAWSTAGNPYFPNQFTRSTDGGQTWMQPIELPQQPIWGTLSVGPDGELYIVGRPNNSGQSLLLRSSNAQNAAQTPVFELVTRFNIGGTVVFRGDPNPAGLLGQSWVATDHSAGPTRGNVYVLSTVDPPGNDPADVMFARSEDGGQTWSAPLRVNDDALGNNAWQWFGTMSVAPNGRIDAVWNDTRNGGGDPRLSELFYSFSNDGGRNWSANERLSSQFNSHLGWPQQNKLGDYYDMVSDRVGANLAWAATFNGEQDVYYLRIGDYDCNGNGVPDTQDLINNPDHDCNNNGIPDECEIAAGTLPDLNGNGIPDECECVGDLDGDGDTDLGDLGILLADFGCAAPGPCVGDLDDDGDTDLADLGILLADFGCAP